MTTQTLEIPTQAQPRDMLSTSEIVGRLSDTMCGVSIHMKQWRINKGLTTEQRGTMADAFGAKNQSVSGSKKLINSKNETYRNVGRVFSEAYAFWQYHSMPYPQHGMRLQKKDAISEFRQQFMQFQNRMTIAVDDLERELPSLMEAQKDELGRLWCEADYPRSVSGLYELSFDVSDINPPSYLAQMDPALFAEQMERAQERIQHSISLLENEFLKDMAEVVESLVKGLSKTEGGKRKSLRNTSVAKLNAFFSRVNELNVGSSGQINSLIDRARDAMAGRQLTDLKNDDSIRDDVKDQLEKLKTEVDLMIETRTGRQFEIVD